MTAPALSAQIQGLGVVTADQYNTFLQGCDTVAQLRAFTGLPGMEVDIRGYATVGDGGAGRFYWSASSSANDDGGVTAIVPVSASGGAWLRFWNSANPTPIVRYSYQQAATGFTIVYPAQISVLDIDPVATLAGGTVFTPVAPNDGQIMTIVSSKTVTSFVLAASAGQTIQISPTTLLAGVALSYLYKF